MTGRLLGLRCFGFSGFSWVKWEDSGTKQFVTEQKNTQSFLSHQQRDRGGLNWFFMVRDKLLCRRLKFAVWRWVTPKLWTRGEMAMLVLVKQMESGHDGLFLNLEGMTGRTSVFSSFSLSLLWVIQDFRSEVQSWVLNIICWRLAIWPVFSNCVSSAKRFMQYNVLIHHSWQTWCTRKTVSIPNLNLVEPHILGV